MGLPLGTNIRKPTVLGPKEKSIRRSEGTLCMRCSGSGYKGRVGTYELMLISRNIQNAIKQNKTTQEIEDIARSEGMLTLRDYAIKLVENQLTTVSELVKILNSNFAEEQDEIINREENEIKTSPSLPKFLE